MSSSVKKILACLGIVLVALIVVIIILASKDEVVKTPEELGETIIAEAATREEIPETAVAEEVPEETEPEVKEVDLPNEKEVSLYIDRGGTMEKISEYRSTWTPDADIAIFEVFNSDDALINYADYYSVHQDYWDAVDAPLEYKIGYELSFDVGDEHKVITILEPADITSNPDLFMGDAELDEVTGYMGAWVYCDMGQTGTYVHLQQEDMTDGVLMTSIKLRPTPQSDQISNLRLKAFSYSSDSEFDDQGRYIGTHGYEIPIINE